MKVISVLLLGLLFSFDVAVAHPIHIATIDHANTLATDHANTLAITDHAITDHANTLATDHANTLATDHANTLANTLATDLATDHANTLATTHATDHANTLATDPESVVGGRNPQRNPLECDACMFLANGVNQTIIHNPKVVSFVTTDIEEICKVLPVSVQQLCLNAAEQSVPNLLNNLGDFIAREGCSDLGICHTKYS